MGARLPALRHSLDLMPSPVRESPGLLLRDPFRYSDAVLILPPVLAPFLALFDGRHEEEDLRTALLRLTEPDQAGEVAKHFTTTLSVAGFLEDAAFLGLREERHRAFAASPLRNAVHAGQAYPAEAATLTQTLAGYLAKAPAPPRERKEIFALAAPHVTPEGGWRSYAAAYSLLDGEHRGRTFVILGTSHYGPPGRFGLTRKRFRTPLGETQIDLELTDGLLAEGGPAAVAEDYCHAIEHSIEFQVLFLQHLCGPDVRILPILCGAFLEGAAPEEDPDVARFLETLAGVADRAGDRLFWILGIDMAHVGRRYGDGFEAVAREGPLAKVEERDRERCRLLAASDPAGFWQLLQPYDALKWCGSSPLYTFLRGGRPAGGELLHYEQWNIDDASVVSFGGLAFHR